MTIQQISVFAENRSGGLLDIIRALGENHIDIRALNVADTQDFGILRLIVDDVDKAKTVLTNIGSICAVTEVIGVKIPDTPGGLAQVLSLLADHQINVDYLYAFVSVSGHSAYLVLRVADNDAATTLLTANGIELVSSADIEAL